MAQNSFAIPVAGLIPNDPAVAPLATLALTPRQRRELDAALRQAPTPLVVFRWLRDGLQNRQPLARILEGLRVRYGLQVARPFATPPPMWPLAVREPVPHDTARGQPSAAPRPTR